MLRSLVGSEMCIRDSIDIEPADGCEFPKATPGAHVTLHMTPDIVRGYSLTESIRPNRYTLAIQLAQNSRGGSRWVHEQLNVNDTIKLSPPANLFSLQPSTGAALLLAGGIGVTPLLAMAWELHHQQKEFELHICVREPGRMPFHEEYNQWPFADRVHVYVCLLYTSPSPRDS